jgi:sporadic carbohydrate cluster protein (TIGR04323 family)
MSERGGYRGYIASRAVRGAHVPQRVQNLVVRDYAARNALEYKLSAVEYVMPACYMMLESVLDELPSLAGIVAFSLFMLPALPPRRAAVIQRVVAAGCEIHFALENLAIRRDADVAACEDVLRVAATLPAAVFAADYPTMLRNPGEAALLLARTPT